MITFVACSLEETCYKPGYRFSVSLGRKVRTAQSNAPVNSRRRYASVDRESATENNCLHLFPKEKIQVRVKTRGKSSRPVREIVAAGKPCMLKCHIGQRSDSSEESGSFNALSGALMGGQIDPGEQLPGQINDSHICNISVANITESGLQACSFF